MRHTLFALALTFTASVAFAADKIPAHPQIVVITTEGAFKMELVTKEAPHTVEHFLGLVDAGFYDGLIFHRVISGFMVQTGGYTPGFKLKEDEQKIVNESGNAMSNIRGTIAMARTGDPHSANSLTGQGSGRIMQPARSPATARCRVTESLVTGHGAAW